MKKQWKGFVSGVLSTILVLGLVGTAAATVGRKTVEVDYNDIKVSLNGSPVNLVNANGIPVEPFAISGTTYLPVRAVASALGLDVGWNQETRTVELSGGGALAPATNTQVREEVIFNQNGIKVTFLGFQDRKTISKYYEGWRIGLKIENSSGEDCVVQARDVSVNGMMADELFSVKVASGKSIVDGIILYNLEERGIGLPITTAEFKLFIIDPENYSTLIESEVITVE